MDGMDGWMDGWMEGHESIGGWMVVWIELDEYMDS